MFWIGFVITIVGGLIGIPLIRGWIQRIVHRDINKLFDVVRTALIIVGSTIAMLSYIQNQHEKEVAEKSLRETQEELRKANDEIAAVRDIARRDEYHPLSSELRRILISELRAVRDRFGAMSLQIFVIATGASQIRQQIAADLAAILSEAMFNATLSSTSPFSLRVLPDAEITTAPAHSQLTDALVPIFRRFITRLLQSLNASKISWSVSGRGQTSPLPWLGCPQARLIHDLEKQRIRPPYANAARRGSMTS